MLLRNIVRDLPKGFELSHEEEEYKEKYDLDDEQMYWRRLKIGEGGPRKFMQEYPACAEEAFLVSGHNVFNQEKVHAMIAKEPLSVREYMSEKGVFDEFSAGHLEIWEYPDWNSQYVIGADVAQGVGQDYSVATVMDSERRIVAMYRHNRLDATEFGETLFYLGRYYNNALLCVESNSIGQATLARLDQMDYINLYYQTKVADLSNDEGTRAGFRTTVSSKPQIIATMQNAIEEDDIYIPSKSIISELKTYVSNDNGKMEALTGTHDDTVISVALCLEVLRTHRDRLSNDRVTWKQRSTNIVSGEDWI